MCTMIASTTQVQGAGKGSTGWFPITQATVGYDHASHCDDEHAMLLDFVNYDLGTNARVAVELDLESARALVQQLNVAIDLAEKSGA